MRKIDASQFNPYEELLLAPAILSEYSHAKCGGPCAGLFAVEDAEMLRKLIRCCIRAEIPYRVLGGMSNILVSDNGYDGMVLLNRKGRITHTDKNGEMILQTDSGAPMAAVVRYCTEHSLSGFEWAAGLPGTVGGAVYGNAGAFGIEIAYKLLNCEIMEADGTVSTTSQQQMEFSYRSSKLKETSGNRIILNASFPVYPGNIDEIRAKVEEVRIARRGKQPITEPSLGSVFKNPEGESAGRLIQAAGLKGMSIGKATVSMIHGNIFTTEKGVRSKDYYDLVLTVQKQVGEMFGIYLEPEIEFLGFENHG